MNIIQNLKTTNELLLFIINKHNISLGALLNDDGACIQDVIDNNNFLIDSGGWIGVDDMLPKEFETVLLFGKKYNGETLITSGHLVQSLVDEFGVEEGFSVPIFITHWQPMPQTPKE